VTLPTPAQLLIQSELARRELARREYLPFVRLMHEHLTGGAQELVVTSFQQHLAAVCEYAIRELLAGREPRIIVEAPPRHGKSMFVSNYLAPWLYLQDPSLFVIHTTYNQAYANDLGKLVREVMFSPLYAQLNPKAAPDPNTAAVNRIDTVSRGEYHSTGMAGPLTGLGGHLMILDDPVKNADEADSPAEMERQWEWYTRVFRQRAMPRSGIFIVLTRWGSNDVAGRVLETAAANPNADQWQVFKYEAICTDPANDPLRRPEGAALDPVRYPLPALQRLKASISPRAWSAQFQQNPIPESGGFFDMKELDAVIKPVASIPPTDKLTIYITVDFAIGEKEHNDYTVVWAFGVDEDDNVWFLPDAKRFRKADGTVIDVMLDMAGALNARELIVEDGHIFRALRDLLKQRMRERKRYFSLTSPYPTKDKTSRAVPLRARIQQKKVFFPDCPFVRDVFVHEAASFGGRKTTVHDDTIDAAALGVGQLTRLMRGSPDAGPASHSPFKSAEPGAEGLTWDELKARTRPAARASIRKSAGTLVRCPRHLNGRAR
jgi:predicted phage terminase large subunit-like protein